MTGRARRCLDENAALEFLDGRSSTTDAQDIESHLDACPQCRRLLVQINRARLASQKAASGVVTQDVTSQIPTFPWRYSLLGERGRGGQARVLVAYDETIGRDVALKELLPEESGAASTDPSTPIGQTAQAAARFLREARVTGQLAHPGIVPVYEIGRREDGRLYYTMQLVRGQTLAQALAKTGGLRERLRLLGHYTDLCNAVAYAHSRGVIHRDLKPQNVMVGAFGETVLLDWGLAKVRGQADERAEALRQDLALLDQVDAALTRDGTALGTPSYMSPEQARGQVETIDERSDVWGLGAVLYQILTGRPPFVGRSSTEVLEAVRTSEVEPVRAACPEAPPELAAIAERALSREQQKRYSAVGLLVEEIEAWMTGERVGSYPYSAWELLRRFAVRHRVALLAGAAVLLAVLGGWWAAGRARQHRVASELARLEATFAELEQRWEAERKTRTEAFEAFDRDDRFSGEARWRAAVDMRATYTREVGALWADLRGVLGTGDGGRKAKELRGRLLSRLAEAAALDGNADLAQSYWQQLGGKPAPAEARLTLVSEPEGATAELVRFEESDSGRLVAKPLRSLGKTPLAGVAVSPGSYLVRLELAGHVAAQLPVALEPGEERSAVVPLVRDGGVPPGMLYVPPGEFLTGTDEPEAVRRETGAIPQHRSYAEGFLIDRHEITFADYLPFLLQLAPKDRAAHLPRGPYRVELPAGGAGTARLSFAGQSRAWGEPFTYPDDPDATPQDWRRWPVAVTAAAAEAFARWKTKRLKAQGFDIELRLPTELEWEKAARGADGRVFPTGASLPDDAAVTRATRGALPAIIAEVGSRTAGDSVFGVADMAGNAWEWVRLRPGFGPADVALKGGSFRDGPLSARAAARLSGEDPSERDLTGFRLAASLAGHDPCPADGPIPKNQDVALAQARACRDLTVHARVRGDYATSERRAQRRVEILRVIRGDDHTDTAQALTDQAEALRIRGDLAGALARQQEALALLRRTLGDEDIGTARALTALGAIQMRRGAHDQALEHHKRALEILRRTLGDQHIEVARVLGAMAQTLLQRGRYAEGLTAIEEAISIREHQLGPEHPSTLNAKHDKAALLLARGAYQDAAALQRQVLAAQIRHLGADHPDVANCYNNLGLTFSELGDHDQALDYFRRGVAVRERIRYVDNTETAANYNNLAAALTRNGELDRALHYSQRSFAIRLRKLGSQHSDVASSYLNLGELYLIGNELDLANQQFQRAFDIYVKTVGPGHPGTSYAIEWLAAVAWARGNTSLAIDRYGQVISIREKTLPAGHWHIGEAHREIGGVLTYLGRLDEALAHYQKAERLFSAALGPSNERTVLLQRDLAELLLRRDDPQASATWRQARDGADALCDNDDAKGCATAALARCHLGDCGPETLALTERAISLDARLPEAVEARAFILQKSGRGREARQVYCSLKKMRPLDQPDARLRRERACP